MAASPRSAIVAGTTSAATSCILDTRVVASHLHDHTRAGRSAAGGDVRGCNNPAHHAGRMDVLNDPPCRTLSRHGYYQCGTHHVCGFTALDAPEPSGVAHGTSASSTLAHLPRAFCFRSRRRLTATLPTVRTPCADSQFRATTSGRPDGPVHLGSPAAAGIPPLLQAGGLKPPAPWVPQLQEEKAPPPPSSQLVLGLRVELRD